MRQVWKFSSILAVLALLVVMGLSTQGSVHAQTADVRVPGSATAGISYVCSDTQTDPRDGCAAADARFDVVVAGATGAGALNSAGTDSNGDGDFTDPGEEPPGTVTTTYDPSRVVTIHNLDLARDTAATTPFQDRNPKTVYLGTGDTTFTVDVVRKSTGLSDTNVTGTFPALTINEVAAGNTVQVKGFHGNRIRITYSSGTGSIGTDTTVTVDDVKPTLVSNSPTAPLISKGNTDIIFSADITDSLSGYTALNPSTGGGINALADSTNAGPLSPNATDPNRSTDKGGVRLVVAGNLVALDHTNFTKIDGGWRVTKDLGSSALQSISTNIPWYFETRDRAGNKRRTSGSISGKSGGPIGGATATDVQKATTLVDTKFAGKLGSNTFAGSSIRVTREDALGNPVISNVQPLAVGFASGQFTFTNAYTDDTDFSDRTDDPGAGTDVLFNDRQPVEFPTATSTTPVAGTSGYQCPFDLKDIDRNKDGTIAAASNPPVPATDEQQGVIDTDSAAQLAACGAISGANYEILGSNLITVDSRAPTLSAALTGKAYNPVTRGDRVAKNSIKLTFDDLGAMNSTAPGSGLDASTVTASAFSVSGSSVVAASLQSGNRVYLTLAENLGSTDRPTVSMASGAIKDRAGNAAETGRIDKATDGLGPNLTLSKSADLSNSSVTVTIATDEQLSGPPTVWITEAMDADGTAEVIDSGMRKGLAPKSSADGMPASSSDVRQTGAQAYSYTMRASGTNDGEYSVFVRATDTNGNPSTAGDAASSSTANAFSFELDSRLNGSDPPKVTVGEDDTITEDGSVLEAEAVDPLIVTVDFSNEGLARGKEYQRDGYRTVELTSAKLKVTFADGTSETKTFDLTTEVTSPDNVKFTIPMLNPKIGTYELTVRAEDSAGNVRIDSAGSTPQDLKATWKVISPRPVSIELAPGWNLISLPFQPANPAINSVVPANHPADIVMTYDNASQVWMVSRRDAETGQFTGDIAVLTANTAYFVRTDNFQPIKVLRPPLATAAAAPPPPPAITVVEGWNLVPVVTNNIPAPEGIAADDYFGTLGSGGNIGWLKALTFDTLTRTWTSVTPGDTVTVAVGGMNLCTGKAVDADAVTDGTELCQKSAHTDRSTAPVGKVEYLKGATLPAAPSAPAVDDYAACRGADDIATKDCDLNNDGLVGKFDANDRVVLKAPVTVGNGYWLYATSAGVIIP